MRLTRVQVRRVDVIKPVKGRRTAVRADQRKRSLLEGGRVASVLRHGKRLALVAEDGRVLEFGLGMSGHLEYSEGIRGRPEQPHEHLRVHDVKVLATPPLDRHCAVKSSL